MAGQFYLGDSMEFTFMTPWNVTTTNGSVSSLTFASNSAMTAVVIFKPDGTGLLSLTALNALPTGFSFVGFLGDGDSFSVRVGSAYFTQAGRYRASIASVEVPNSVPQFDYCDVLPYYNPEKLTQVFDPGTNAMLHKTGGINGTTVQYQLAYDVNGNPATTYAAITALGPIVVGVP